MGTILHRVKLGAWRWPHLGLALVTALLVVMVGPWRLVASDGTPASNYEKAQAQPFNQVTTYPISPLPSSPLLQPNGDWIGRLILPSVEEYQQKPGDWVWMEVWHSLAGLPDLTGQRVKLTWKPSPMNQAYLDQVTRDIDFSDQATKFLENGNIVPTRLNGRRQVGPLQSLAGARPQDDMTVRLVEPDLVREDGQWVLRTGLEPIQITGREYGLVKILGPDTGVTAPPPADCPGPTPCPGEYFRVQFFNPSSKSFSGPTGTVRIPQQPRMKGDRFFSNLQDLENSPAGVEGWYIYGSRDSQGLFTVQALKPRALFRLQPDQVILTEREGLKYLDRGNWKETPQRKGTLQRVLISPNAGSSDAARAQWQEGDRALVIHLFGGIGGDNKELTPLGTVTGHFAYGLAQVKREPITQELQFAIQYQQIYAHNSGGVVSGTHDWHEYMGDLQRGWMGLRPVSDVVIKLDAFIEPFQFGDTRISLFRELLIQAQVLAARYRTGDGTGVAAVTPATSCVQDSNQALFIAIQQIKNKIEGQPEVVQWLRDHPESLETQEARQFVTLAKDLEAMLTPYGVIRPDWQNNAAALAGVVPEGDFIRNQGLFSGALSWHSMMPRWGQDQVSRIFLLNGAQLWFLRTNMVGGDDLSIEPIPPTTLMGGIPVVGRVIQRFADAFAVWPTWPMVGLALAALALYGWLALTFGLGNGFLIRRNAIDNPLGFLLNGVRLWFIPALLEETLFRVMLLPHPVEGVPGPWWLLWAIISFLAGIGYHLLLGKTFYRQARTTFCDRRFLTLMGWLSLLLIGLYWISGSLWLVTFSHWAVVMVWIYGFDGWSRLRNTPFYRDSSSPGG